MPYGIKVSRRAIDRRTADSILRYHGIEWVPLDGMRYMEHGPVRAWLERDGDPPDFMYFVTVYGYAEGSKIEHQYADEVSARIAFAFLVHAFSMGNEI